MRRTENSYLPVAPDDLWRYDTPTGVNRALTVIARSIICISFVFMMFPTIDLVVSRWFANGAVFVLTEQPLLKGLRDFSRQSLICIIGAMLLLIGLHIFLPRRCRFCQPHKPLFVLLSFFVGPIIVVEVLKVLIGRARPRDLVEFGGYADFTPVLQFSAACVRNCSFPSGEASAAAAALSLLVLVPAKLRRIAAIALTPCLLFIAFNRVLFGAHFLSDVVFAWLFTMLAMVWIWKWMEARAKDIDKFFARTRP